MKKSLWESSFGSSRLKEDSVMKIQIKNKEKKMKKLLIFVLSFLSLGYSIAQDKIFPNDPFFKYQFSFYNPGGKIAINIRSYRASLKEFDAQKGIDLNIVRAWAITIGTKNTIVAILDDGFFYQHEDIRDNIWKNHGEIGVDQNEYRKETNGIDDDNNCYVDDVMGWDFAFDDPDPDCYIFDGMDPTRIQPYWHSISAMGIIGAKGNNGIGVAGINWDVSMMLLKIGAQGIKKGEADTKQIDRVVKAIRYAADNGARVINWSGFVSDLRQEKRKQLKEAIDYAESKDVLLIVGAGNSAKNIDLKENFIYPACFDNDNIITVAEIDFKGDLLRYEIEGCTFGSNYGVKNVDVAAIGNNYTTDLKHNMSVYELSGGTSSSAPVVTGVAALLLSVRPDLKACELKEILMKSVTKLSSLEGKVKSGGMVNAFNALKIALEN